MSAEDRLRAAVHGLDADLDLYEAHQQHRRVEETYLQRTSSPGGVAILTAAAAAVDAHAQGEAAARGGDDDLARAQLTRAHRLGLPGTAPPKPTRAWTDCDLDTVADAASAGDLTALADLLTRLRPLVARYCQGRMERVPAAVLEPDADAQDLVQDVLMDVLIRLPERAGRPVAAFAVHVARRTIRTHARLAPITAELDAGLRDLPIGLRNVLVARTLLGRSVDETAELLDMTPGAVRVAQHRALTRLRDQLRS